MCDLLNITKMSINYFETLDYADIMKLQKTCREFVIDNSLLCQIIYNKNNYVNIPKNFDVTGIIKSVYDQILAFIYDNYPKKDAPRWVVHEIFVEDMMKSSMESFIDDLLFNINEENNVPNIIEIHKSKFSFPYHANRADTPYCDDGKLSWLDTSVKLSPECIDYIQHIVTQITELGQNEHLDKALKSLFLIQ